MPMTTGQWAVMAALIALAAAALLASPHLAASMFLFCISLAFLATALLRLGALQTSQAPRPPPRRRTDAPPSEDWPRFTLLVPLYREAEIVVETIAALAALSYPKERLEILFLFEDDDRETREAFLAVPHPPHMRAVLVPPGFPRTKPRALCHGMRQATGDYITVYDAEDLPDPDQLQSVLATFRANPECGCVQAALNIDNREKNWLTGGIA